jgi:hypothetical protein
VLHRIVRHTRMAEEARVWYLSQRMFRRSMAMLKFFQEIAAALSIARPVFKNTLLVKAMLKTAGN